MKETFKKFSKVFLALMMVLIMAAPISQKAEAATKVSAPKITSVSNVSSGITVKWSKVSNATGYYVYRKTTGSYKKIATVKSKSTITYTDKTAKSGTTYTYAVKAYKSKTVSSYSAAKKIKRLSNPSVTVSNTSSGVKVSWKKVTGAAKYRIYYQKSGKWVKLTDTTSTSYTDKTLKSGSSRSYTVRAISGSYMSGYNSGKAIKRLSQPSPSVSNASTGVKISWSKVTGAAKYRVYYKKSGSWTKLADVTGTSYTDTSVTSGTSRTYTVKAISSNYSSSYVSGKTIKRLAQPVVSVSEAASGKFHVNITWKKITGASKYRIYYKDDSKWVKLTDTTSTSYTDKTCTGGTRIYTVKAISGSYVSSYCSGVQYVHTHTFVDTVGEAATCTEYGLMYHTCSKCGIMYTTEIKPIGHSYTSEVTKEAGCETEGVLTYTCSKCGDTYTEEIPMKDHTYTSEVTKEASCTEAGVRTYTCSGCGAVYTEEIPAEGHNYTEAVTKAATCEEDGVITHTCSNCGDSYDETISAAGHSYTSEVTKEASCEEEGVRTYTCGTCGDTYTEAIAAGEHDWIEQTEKINRAYHICNACGEKFYVDEYDSNADAIKAWINHSCSAGGGSYSTDNETVTVVTGYTCSKCGATKDAE